MLPSKDLEACTVKTDELKKLMHDKAVLNRAETLARWKRFPLPKGCEDLKLQLLDILGEEFQLCFEKGFVDGACAIATQWPVIVPDEPERRTFPIAKPPDEVN
jgi:hypothetical protein